MDAPLTILALRLTTAELAHHDQPDDCWMLIDGIVYDLTPWVEAHPGGDALLRGCGKDASDFFADRDGLGSAHSSAAQTLLEGYALGPLGSTVEEARTVEPVHPHATRLEGTRTGLAPTTGVGPAKSVALRVVHNFSTQSDTVPNGMLVNLGYSFGRVDVGLTDVRAPGIGGLEVKARVLDQYADTPRPLSVSLGGGGGFASVAGAPALYGQLTLERQLLERRLALRTNATGFMAPGVDESGALSAGAGVELRPIPIHGLFVEAQVPFADPALVAWSAGARIYTRGHVFNVYAASSAPASAWEIASPLPRALAIGASVEKAFRL